jgi:hypothetical protein
MLHGFKLEDDLGGSLEDSRTAACLRGDLTEAGRGQGLRHTAEGEVRVVQDVERFQPKVQAQVLMERKEARDLAVELEEGWGSERIPAEVSVGSGGSAVRGYVCGTDFSERGGVEIFSVRFSGTSAEGSLGIGAHSWYEVGAILTYVGEGIIRAGLDVHGLAAGDVEEGSDLPVID